MDTKRINRRVAALSPVLCARGSRAAGPFFQGRKTSNFLVRRSVACSGHNSFPARLTGMHTLQAVICSGTTVAAKRRKKNKTAAVAVAAMCSTHATSVRPGGAEKTVKKKEKRKKMRKKKSAMSGTGFSSAIEPVAVAAVAARVAAVVDPNPVDTIFADGQARRKAKQDAQKIKLEEQEAQEALVKEAETMARRPSHSRVVDPIFFEEYDPAEKIDPQRAQVHRVRRRAKSGVPI